MNEDVISKYEAYTAMRFFMRLREQINDAMLERRFNDSIALSGMFGALEYRVFGDACFARQQDTGQLKDSQEVA